MAADSSKDNGGDRWASTTWSDCRLCKTLPDGIASANLLDEEDGLSQEAEEILQHASLSSGYKAWVATCPECHTRYLAEVDVEPFVWDVTLERERADGTASTQFGDSFEFPSP